MKKFFVQVLLLLSQVCCATTVWSCPPGYPGESVHWRAAYCMQKHETDDFLHPGVQQCFSEQELVDGTSATSCELNLQYKKAICEGMVETEKDLSLQACIDAADTVPWVVSQGGV